MSDAIKIPLQSLRTGESECAMELYTVKDAFYAEIDASEAKANGEAQWQIREGCEYEYALPEGMRFEGHPTISQSVRKPNEGRIRPGNYVGRLELKVVSSCPHTLCPPSPYAASTSLRPSRFRGT